MSRKKISELTSTTDLVSGDVFIVNDNGTTKKVDFDVLQEKVRGYKSFVALLTQLGTNAPTMQILNNDFDNTPVWVYNSVGLYTLTFTGSPLTVNKTYVLTGSPYSVSFGFLDAGWFDANNIELYSANDAGVQIDGNLSNSVLEIRVYE